MGDKNGKIYIDKVSPGGEDLLGCYFKLKPDGKYNFHDQHHGEKGTDITVGSSFKFRLDQREWELSLNEDLEVILKGDWSHPNQPPEGEGTYQAEAGGAGEEEPTAASAGGY